METHSFHQTVGGEVSSFPYSAYLLAREHEGSFQLRSPLFLLDQKEETWLLCSSFNRPLFRLYQEKQTNNKQQILLERLLRGGDTIEMNRAYFGTRE